MNGVREYVGYGDASDSRNTFLYVHMYIQLLDVSNSLPEQLIKVITADRALFMGHPVGNLVNKYQSNRISCYVYDAWI